MSVTAPTIDSPAITLSGHAGELVVRPACPALRTVLRTVRHDAEQPVGAGFRVRRSVDSLAEEVNDTQYIPPGLLPVVRQVLASHGSEVYDQVVRPAGLPAPQLSRLAKLGGADERFLQFVRRCDRGIISIPSLVRPTSYIAQVAHAWPDRTVVVLVSRLEEANAVAKELRRLRVDARAVTSRSRNGVVGRVIVVTPKYFDAGYYHTQPAPMDSLGCPSTELVPSDEPSANDSAWYDIVIAFSALEGINQAGRDALRRAERARVFGFLEQAERPSPRERDLLAGYFGFDEFVIPRPGNHERAVRVTWRDVCGGYVVPSEANGIVLKRQAIWHHSVRNRRIVKLAQEASRSNSWKFDPTPDGAVAAPQVVVLVEGVEHGVVLARKLRWPLYCSPATTLDGLNTTGVDVVRSQLAASMCVARCAVVTAQGLQRIDLPQVNILIRADGGTGLPTLPEDALTVSDCKKELPLILIDFDDQHHPALRRRSYARLEAYRSQGWFPFGEDPRQVRIDNFLDNRPRENN